jgi:hypothetical protein
MAQSQIANILIAIVVMGLVVGGLGSILTWTAAQNNVIVDPHFADAYNKINETNGLTSQISEKLQGSDVSTVSGVWQGITGAGLAAKLMLTEPFVMTKLLTTTVADTLQVPPMFVTAFLAIVLIVIIFAIWYMFFRPMVVS